MGVMKISALEATFWICLGAVAYNYAGYPLLLVVLSAMSQAKSDLKFLFRREVRRSSEWAQTFPRVGILLSAYNEAGVIQAKVKNTLALDYPADRMEILIGLDAPTDSTPELGRQMESTRVQVVHFQERQGKLKVLCALARMTSAEILVITDANTSLESSCLRMLVRHFADPRVGAVSGEEIRVPAPGTDPGAESLYWKYESALKFLENRLNCSLGANGSVLAVRSALFRPSRLSIVEDLEIPLTIRFQGYRVVYDPEAVAKEEIAPTLSAQFARRVRVGAGDFQTLCGNLRFLDPRKGLPAFCYFSHRVLRWIAPFLLLIALLSSMAMCRLPVYATLVTVQLVFYLAALLGFLGKRRGKRVPRIFSLPFQFCLMNLALFLGLFKYLTGRQTTVWTSTPRQLRNEAG
jgi:cellulose synthase/poly-beta-1,6-N-acetylglucosamine synthase-like glycosyltransferase